MSKTREEWEAERDLAILSGQNRAAEWIDRKILYPIGNLINGKYPGDEKFKCSCGSHVGVKLPPILEGFKENVKCVVCYDKMIKNLASHDDYEKMLGKATYFEKDVGVEIFDE